MKKFLTSALLALMLFGFGTFTEAGQAEQENLCCRSGYCASDCDYYDSGYCERY